MALNPYGLRDEVSYTFGFLNTRPKVWIGHCRHHIRRMEVSTLRVEAYRGVVFEWTRLSSGAVGHRIDGRIAKPKRFYERLAAARRATGQATSTPDQPGQITDQHSTAD